MEQIDLQGFGRRGGMGGTAQSSWENGSKIIWGQQKWRCTTLRFGAVNPKEKIWTDVLEYQDRGKLQPATSVHIDVTQRRGLHRVCEVFGEKRTTGRRTAIINIWRPLVGPVIDAPLALCEATSLGAGDLDQITDSYGGGYFIRHNTGHKWWFLKDQMPDEVLLFRSYDSTKGLDVTGCAHAAFMDRERLAECKIPRQSIEIRCAVLY